MKNILIAIINYSNEKEVISYAKSIAEQTVADRINLAIVNNKTSNNFLISLADEIKKINLSIHLFEPNDNLGYLNGALYGYREFVKKTQIIPDWFIVSNTDIDILDDKFFEKLINNNYDDDIQCIAPSVFSPNSKSYQNPHYSSRISLRKLNRVIRIHKFPILAFLYSKLSRLKTSLRESVKQESQYVYSAHGCFFALKREFIESIKNNYYEGFLYSEESYIAENLLRKNKKCFYDSNLELVHNENSVTGLLGTKKRAKYIASSLEYIRDEFYTCN